MLTEHESIHPHVKEIRIASTKTAYDLNGISEKQSTGNRTSRNILFIHHGIILYPHLKAVTEFLIILFAKTNTHHTFFLYKRGQITSHRTVSRKTLYIQYCAVSRGNNHPWSGKSNLVLSPLCNYIVLTTRKTTQLRLS